MSATAAVAGTSVVGGLPPATRIDALLPSGRVIGVEVPYGANPVCEVKRVVSNILKVSPLLTRVTIDGGTDSFNSAPLRVTVVLRQPPQRNTTVPLTVQTLSEQKVPGVSKFDVQVDPADTVLDLKFLLEAAGTKVRPDFQRLYVRPKGARERKELKDGQTLASYGLIPGVPGSGPGPATVIRLMFEFPSGLAGHGTVHCTRAELLERPLGRGLDHCQSMGDIFLACVKAAPNNKFLGTRTFPDPTKPTEIRGPYQWLTYAQSAERIFNLISGFKALGIEPKQSIGIVGQNRTEWVLTDHACSLGGFVSVPLYDTLGPDAYAFIINHAEVRVVVASTKELKAMSAIRKSCPALEFVVVMDDNAPDVLALESGAIPRAMYTHRFSEIEALGKKPENISRSPAGVCSTKGGDILTICYTSGTTGNPKGAVISHGNLLAAISASEERIPPEERKADEPEVLLSYLPLAHIYERLMEASIMINQGMIGFSQGDPLKLLDDVGTLKPTIFPGVPRVWQRIYDKIGAQVGSSGLIKSVLFQKALSSKLGKLQSGEWDKVGVVTSAWDKIVFKKIADMFGGKVRLMVTGAAPLSPTVGDFMRVSFLSNFVEGYGMTETCGVTSCASIDDGTYGHVGAPLDCTAVKLVDVEDMEYRTSDYPYPRGEICVRSPSVFQGYYKEPEKTAEVFHTDLQGNKWLMTGDIGMWLPDGSLKIIDRKKNLFKLSQGEYLRPEYIENVLKGAKSVANVFVHGDSNENFLVAIVFPEAETIQAFVAKEGIKGKTLREWVSDPRVQKFIFADMEQQGHKEKLRGFEFVKKIHVVAEDFTIENGLLTPTMKLKRNVAAKYFADPIKKMYAEGEKAAEKIKAKL